MTVQMAEVFFRYCRRYKVPPEEKARLAVVRRLVAKKKAQYIRDAQEFMKGKKTIGFRPKES